MLIPLAKELIFTSYSTPIMQDKVTEALRQLRQLPLKKQSV